MEEMMGSHAALIAELEKAEEGTRALSDEVLLALGWKRKHAVFPGGARSVGMMWIPPDTPGIALPDAPHPTGNLQDILDVTVVCSYIELHIELPMDGCDTVCTAIIRIDNETRHVGTSSTPALALSAANVKAV